MGRIPHTGMSVTPPILTSHTYLSLFIRPAVPMQASANPWMDAVLAGGAKRKAHLGRCVVAALTSALAAHLPTFGAAWDGVSARRRW